MIVTCAGLADFPARTPEVTVHRELAPVEPTTATARRRAPAPPHSHGSSSAVVAAMTRLSPAPTLTKSDVR